MTNAQAIKESGARFGVMIGGFREQLASGCQRLMLLCVTPTNTALYDRRISGHEATNPTLSNPMNVFLASTHCYV